MHALKKFPVVLVLVFGSGCIGSAVADEAPTSLSFTRPVVLRSSETLVRPATSSAFRLKLSDRISTLPPRRLALATQVLVKP